MQIQLVHIKAATAGERIGTLQCLNGFIRKRIMEHLEKLEGVQNVKRIAWDIVYFETKDGFKAEDVLEAVHMIVPVFAAEMNFRPKWLIRNFWLLWGIAFGICHLLDTVEYYLDGGDNKKPDLCPDCIREALEGALKDLDEQVGAKVKESV